MRRVWYPPVLSESQPKHPCSKYSQIAVRRDRSCQASSLCIWVRGGSSILRLRIGVSNRSKLINKIILPTYYEFKIMTALPTHFHIRRKSVQKWQMPKVCKCACRNFGKECATRNQRRKRTPHQKNQRRPLDKS